MARATKGEHVHVAEMETPKDVKERGNDHYKNKDYVEAAICYTKALELSSKDGATLDRSIYYKNRAACYLKLSKYEEAEQDCLSALKITPNDSKSLYRYAQALEGAGKEAESLIQLKKLLAVDSGNREANEMARRLVASLKKTADRFQSTENVLTDMYQCLSDPQSGGEEKKIQAAKNLAILAHQEGGADKIYRSGGVAKLIPHLKDKSPELVNHVLQVFVGMVTKNRERSIAIFEQVTPDRLAFHVGSPHPNISSSAVGILKEIVVSLAPPLKVDEDDSDPSPLSPLILPIVQLMFISLLKQDLSGHARDCVLEFFVKTISLVNMNQLYVDMKLVEHLLELSTHTWSDEARPEGISEVKTKLAVSNNCRMNISMTLSTLYNAIQGRDDKGLRDSFKEQCKSFVLSRIKMADVHNQLGTLSALACLLQGVVEIGNEIFSQEFVLQLPLEMAESSDVTSQSLAAEVLTLAASDKSRCQGLMDKGLPALKTLYHSKDDGVQVKALVGLCKLGSTGGGNVNARPFAEGATLKLEKTCRKYLVSTKKGEDLRKWAAEGIAFLSLDAEVKEALIRDEQALKELFKLVSSPDKSLLYGIVSIFVNLTNSYDKPEKNPELEELGKFAGENVPKEHEMDGIKYVKNRVSVLLKCGIIVSLNELAASSESKAIREQVSRVFLALCEEPSNRGYVIQQGGVKSLIPLSLENTEKGKLIASQALAKIGITNNPQLAFSGQRILEVIRPMVQLLKSESGLQQFEGLMSLTNLASVSDEVRQRIIREGAVPLMEGLMFEEEELIRRASTEALCNMIQEEEVQLRFHGDDMERVKLWMLFSGEDDEQLARAASGGLAQLSHDPKICQKIMEVKSATEILKELVTKDSNELMFRGMYILANLMEASREIAEKIIQDDFMEVFMAYVQGESPDNVKAQAERALKKGVEYGLIMPNPDIQ